MKSYTEEEVKTIVGNVVQHITDNISVEKNYDLEAAKIHALESITAPEDSQESNKQSSLRRYHSSSRLSAIIKLIRQNQYHLDPLKFIERQKLN